jgi:hypothetical protein
MADSHVSRRAAVDAFYNREHPGLVDSGRVNEFRLP